MGKTTIPAVTVIHCDRCKKADDGILGKNIRSREFSLHKQGYGLTLGGELTSSKQKAELDLCDECAGAFDKFMNNETFYITQMDKP